MEEDTVDISACGVKAARVALRKGKRITIMIVRRVSLDETNWFEFKNDIDEAIRYLKAK